MDERWKLDSGRRSPIKRRRDEMTKVRLALSNANPDLPGKTAEEHFSLDRWVAASRDPTNQEENKKTANRIHPIWVAVLAIAEDLKRPAISPMTVPLS